MPERLYLETRWASLVPYAATAELLADVLPITTGANATTVRQHVLRVAERAEAELPKDLCTFMDGNPADWEALPIPDGRIVVGLDGGYVVSAVPLPCWFEPRESLQFFATRHCIPLAQSFANDWSVLG